MRLNELREKATAFKIQYTQYGTGPNENTLFDYKKDLNLYGLTKEKGLEIFMRNFAKDILSFANCDGGIIILGLKEKEEKGTFEDCGIQGDALEILTSLEINDIMQKIQSITQVNVNVELQKFQIVSKFYFSLLIEKQSIVVFPVKDFDDYKLYKGDITYRLSGKNQIANVSSQEFDKFLQAKAAEKNKEFMEIWTKLLPEIFDINPKEILMINPKTSKIYGFNGKEGLLSSSDIEIEKEESGVFNIILNAINAGDIGKITTDEGKPIYKIVGELNKPSKKESITITTFLEEVNRKSINKISNVELKLFMHYLGWVNLKDFKVDNPDESIVNNEYFKYVWIESTDKIKGTTKILFSTQGIDKVLKLVNDKTKYYEITGKVLEEKKIEDDLIF